MHSQSGRRHCATLICTTMCRRISQTSSSFLVLRTPLLLTSALAALKVPGGSQGDQFGPWQKVSEVAPYHSHWDLKKPLTCAHTGKRHRVACTHWHPSTRSRTQMTPHPAHHEHVRGRVSPGALGVQGVEKWRLRC